MSAGAFPRSPVATRAEVISPLLRRLLWVVFGLVALLGVNSAYLACVTWMEWFSRNWGERLIYQNYFSLWMFLIHIALGLLLVVPFLAFSIPHLLVARHRRNRRAVRVGYALFGASLVLLATGLMLVRVGGIELKWPPARSVVYWLHVASPIAAVWLYWLHRLAGPPIRWRVGAGFGGLIAVAAIGAAALHSTDPRHWNVAGPKEGDAYFTPSLARTATGNFIPSETLMQDDYCRKCHTDAYTGWFHSAHHFSSFNNPMYLASVRETRAMALKRDGNVQAARWCAGCHDPVPFLSGAFDNPKYDDVKDPTAHAGITCTTCHSITHVNSTRGNADYTIEEPLHYPFANSSNSWLQLVNQQLVKAKPALHKHTFLKPHHKTTEFCSTCHKVHLPAELTDYREFLRGQNHHDAFLLSGVSGHGARSNYFGMKAMENCGGCHMPVQASSDFGAKVFDDTGRLSIHSHLFPGANTALPFLRNEPEIVKAQQDFLKTAVRVDLFGLKPGGVIHGPLTAPLRPSLPALQPGQSYLLEAVVRTLKMGHPFTQGTVDSNEAWVEVIVTSGDQIIASSGGMNKRGEVDRWAYFINNYVIDKDGNRINRRNPQDIFTTLYDHQIPPGAAQVIHYRLDVPQQLTAPLVVDIKVQYRKFDAEYMEFVTRSAKPGDVPIRGYTPGQPYRNDLPISTLATDRIIFPVAGVEASIPEQKYAIKIDHIYQRWNDYGLALLREADGLGSAAGATAELRQAEEIFRFLDTDFGYIDVRANLARVYLAEGRLDEAAAALRRGAEVDKPMFFTEPVYAPWALNWIAGQIHQQQGRLDEAIENFRCVLHDRNQSMADRGFDFRPDYVVRNELGLALWERAKPLTGPERERDLRDAVEQFEQTLRYDAENATAHYNLSMLYQQLGESNQAEEHRRLHVRYKPDDNARDRAAQRARMRDPAANHAAEPIAIYPLRPPKASTAEDLPALSVSENGEQR